MITCLAVWFGCDTKSPDVAKTATSNEMLVKHFFTLFNQHNWNGMASLYLDTATFKDPSLGKKPVQLTQHQVAAKYRELAGIFPDLHDRVTQLYPSGQEHIIVEFTSTGTSADGKRFELPICTIFTIRAGKIVADFTYFDN